MRERGRETTREMPIEERRTKANETYKANNERDPKPKNADAGSDMRVTGDQGSGAQPVNRKDEPILKR